MPDKFTVRLFKIFSICVDFSRVISLGLTLLIVHFRSNVKFSLISFRFGFNLNLCICSWRVGDGLKNTAVVIGACLLHAGCNLVIVVGSVCSPTLCPLMIFHSTFFGHVLQVVFFFLWGLTYLGSVSDECVS